MKFYPILILLFLAIIAIKGGEVHKEANSNENERKPTQPDFNKKPQENAEKAQKSIEKTPKPQQGPIGSAIARGGNFVRGFAQKVVDGTKAVGGGAAKTVKIGAKAAAIGAVATAVAYTAGIGALGGSAKVGVQAQNNHLAKLNGGNHAVQKPLGGATLGGHLATNGALHGGASKPNKVADVNNHLDSNNPSLTTQDYANLASLGVSPQKHAEFEPEKFSNNDAGFHFGQPFIDAAEAENENAVENPLTKPAKNAITEHPNGEKIIKSNFENLNTDAGSGLVITTKTVHGRTLKYIDNNIAVYPNDKVRVIVPAGNLLGGAVVSWGQPPAVDSEPDTVEYEGYDGAVKFEFNYYKRVNGYTYKVEYRKYKVHKNADEKIIVSSFGNLEIDTAKNGLVITQADSAFKDIDNNVYVFPGDKLNLVAPSGNLLGGADVISQNYDPVGLMKIKTYTHRVDNVKYKYKVYKRVDNDDICKVQYRKYKVQDN